MVAMEFMWRCGSCGDGDRVVVEFTRDHVVMEFMW